ncbi:hypothetical protein MESS2_650184 [Mesorhizobium metallidurans STM 2683]|uniref:Uncharacterized protein n=1 Tax=Mesorhizobium metallidurans STM 2683 TaxID=1297569 RepID=M5ESQ9_9HYPH|nr:hypothetical protein MESS2_650184 [Mesorhizobium metallidurans STM 2683]
MPGPSLRRAGFRFAGLRSSRLRVRRSQGVLRRNGFDRRALDSCFMHVVIAKPLHTFARHALESKELPADHISKGNDRQGKQSRRQPAQERAVHRFPGNVPLRISEILGHGPV